MEERRRAILAYLVSHGRASVEELNDLFPGTSAMTIRRDLDYLEQAGEVIRIHGGAMLNPARILQEAQYGVREVENREAKDRIARLAADILGDTRSIYIDAGTTCMEFARQLSAGGLLVTTSGANIAAELAGRNPDMTVTMLGGSLNPRSLAVSGSQSIEQVRNINIDTAVMCTSGYAPGAGFSNGHIGESELKRAVIAKARRVILLMDGTKLGKTLPYTFARPEDVDIIICDRDPGEGASGIPEEKLLF
ncbi:MAG: DeoR/GlpR transcriptional regulator [Clostridia bacterium]|nr:DeoR/GlpR transcriptional regulator [Clostridia bacterium]